jgi:hypothetical protein
MSRILLFDDVPEQRNDICDALSKITGDADTVVQFPDNEVPEKGTSYERHIELLLFSDGDPHEIGLIACDKELGMYDNYPGLSANAVSAVARNVGLPFCQYSRRPKYNEREIDRYRNLRRWNSEEITLAGSNAEDWAREITELWKGFELIREQYVHHDINSLKPALALATIMGRPDAATRISLYGSGDQSVMTEVFAFIKDGNVQELSKRMPRVLGTWLLLSILRFPGLLVNATAAASYLNITVADFATEKVRECFLGARYDGPLSGLDTWWWRDDLDSMLLDEDVSSGREYVATKKLNVAPCIDEETGDPAGFFCMITQSPVSRENSKGNINWFPSGADLCRIRTSEFDQITSLVST